MLPQVSATIAETIVVNDPPSPPGPPPGSSPQVIMIVSAPQTSADDGSESDGLLIGALAIGVPLLSLVVVLGCIVYRKMQKVEGRVSRGVNPTNSNACVVQAVELPSTVCAPSTPVSSTHGANYDQLHSSRLSEGSVGSPSPLGTREVIRPTGIRKASPKGRNDIVTPPSGRLSAGTIDPAKLPPPSPESLSYVRAAVPRPCPQSCST